VSDLQPDTREILQEEPDYVMPVNGCVTIKGPVRTQELPRKSGATRTVTVTTTAKRYLTADHRRAWVQLRALDADDVAYAFNEASATELSTMAELPGGEADRLDVTAELWVRAVTGTARIAITTGNWADGE
jgi:hypothetical protein